MEDEDDTPSYTLHLSSPSGLELRVCGDLNDCVRDILRMLEVVNDADHDYLEIVAKLAARSGKPDYQHWLEAAKTDVNELGWSPELATDAARAAKRMIAAGLDYLSALRKINSNS